jgi:hypothetical protein
MAINYLDILSRDDGGEHAATPEARTPVFYERPRRAKPVRLTKAGGRASLRKRGIGKHKRPRRKHPTGGVSTMAKKRKMSKKQRAAAMRNLAKARRARKRGKVKAPRRAARRASERTKRKSAKRVAAGRKAARTRKRRRAKGAAEWHGQPKRHARAAKKGWAKRRRKSGSRPKRRKTSGRRRPSAKQLRAARRNIRKAQAANRGRRASMGHRSRSSRREDYGAERRRRGGKRRRRTGAMENPLSGVELFVGGILGVAGFGIGDFTDRLLATHPLTDKGTKDANGNELYADNPPATGSYAGLFNPTAITSPMDLARWANAVLVPGTIFVVAHFVRAPTFRSAMQFFAFGYGIRGLGKGVIDLMALVSTKFGLGQRLYDGEMRAMVLKDNNGNQQANALASLPAAGLGAAMKQVGAGCGAGCACAKCKQTPANPPGVGWPSLPREQANAASTSPRPPNAPTNAPPPPAQQPPQGGGSGGGSSGAFSPGPLLGTPRRRGLYTPFGDYSH